MEKDCNNCLCLQCGNDDCYYSACEGIETTPIFSKTAKDGNCHMEKCWEFKEEI